MTAFFLWLQHLFYDLQRWFYDYRICFLITAFFLWLQRCFSDYNSVCQNSVDTIFRNNYENTNMFNPGYPKNFQIWTSTNLNRVPIYTIQYRYANLPMCDIFIESEYPQCWISIYFNDLTRQLSDIKPMRIVLWCHKITCCGVCNNPRQTILGALSF